MYTISTFYVDNIFFNLLLFLNKNDAQMLNENALLSLSIEVNILEMIFFSKHQKYVTFRKQHELVQNWKLNADIYYAFVDADDEL